MIEQWIVELGVSGGIAVIVVGALVRLLYMQQKLISNHLSHNTKALVELHSAVKANTKMLERIENRL